MLSFKLIIANDGSDGNVSDQLAKDIVAMCQDMEHIVATYESDIASSTTEPADPGFELKATARQAVQSKIIDTIRMITQTELALILNVLHYEDQNDHSLKMVLSRVIDLAADKLSTIPSDSYLTPWFNLINNLDSQQLINLKAFQFVTQIDFPPNNKVYNVANRKGVDSESLRLQVNEVKAALQLTKISSFYPRSDGEFEPIRQGYDLAPKLVVAQIPLSELLEVFSNDWEPLIRDTTIYDLQLMQMILDHLDVLPDSPDKTTFLSLVFSAGFAKKLIAMFDVIDVNEMTLFYIGDYICKLANRIDQQEIEALGFDYLQRSKKT